MAVYAGLAHYLRLDGRSVHGAGLALDRGAEQINKTAARHSFKGVL